MYFKLNTSIYNNRIMRLVCNPVCARDGYTIAREAILIRLLSYSADDYEFYDLNSFARLTQSPVKQSEIVWNICLSEGVLSKTDNGYSAKQWLHDCGIISDDVKRARKPRVCDDAQQTCDNTSEAKKSQTDAPACEKMALTEKPAIVETENGKKTERPVKVAVRHNVFLTYSEIEELQKEFTKEQITAMVDKLSDYKSQNNRSYSSDYQAIKRWVVRSVTEQHTPVKVDYPDWITGVKQ
jgi:hypothetical protein